jgi:hypothetical protein
MTNLREPKQNSSPDIVQRDKKFGIIMSAIGLTMIYG